MSFDLNVEVRREKAPLRDSPDLSFAAHSVSFPNLPCYGNLFTGMFSEPGVHEGQKTRPHPLPTAGSAGHHIYQQGSRSGRQSSQLLITIGQEPVRLGREDLIGTEGDTLEVLRATLTMPGNRKSAA